MGAEAGESSLVEKTPRLVAGRFLTRTTEMTKNK